MNQINQKKATRLPEVSGWITAAVQHSGGSLLCLWLCICLSVAFTLDGVVAVGDALATQSLAELITGLSSQTEFSALFLNSLPTANLLQSTLILVSLWLFFFSSRRQPNLTAAKVATVFLRVVVTIRLVLYTIGLFALLLCSGFLVALGLSAGSSFFANLMRQISAMFGVGMLFPQNSRWSMWIPLILLAGLFLLFLFHLLGCVALRRGLTTLSAQCGGNFGKRPIPYLAVLYVGVAPWLSVNKTTLTLNDLGDIFTLLSLVLTVIGGILGALLLTRHRKAMHQGQAVFTGALCHFKEDHSFIANHQSAANTIIEESAPKEPCGHFLDELTVDDPFFSLDLEEEEDDEEDPPCQPQTPINSPPCPQEPSPTPVCPRCGQPLQSHQRFCYNCGQTL